MVERDTGRTSDQNGNANPRTDSILSGVSEPLTWLGFSCEGLREDIPKTQQGGYCWESYLCGPEANPSNLALISLPPGISTNPSRFIGPPDVKRGDFSFAVHSLAGYGQLVIMRPDGSIEANELYRGAPVYYVRPGDIYALRAAESGLVVGDYCDPCFKPQWELAVDRSELPKLFIRNLMGQAPPSDNC
jgi:hypothetical protein